MPSSKAIVNNDNQHVNNNQQQPKLDLNSWAKFKPPERPHDFEYSRLLGKFKTLLEEVKEFHHFHSDCSLSRQFNVDINLNKPSTTNQQQQQPSSFEYKNNNDSNIDNPRQDSTSLSISVNNRFKVPPPTPANNSFINNKSQLNVLERRSYFQQQNSLPITNNCSPLQLRLTHKDSPLVKQSSLHSSTTNFNTRTDPNLSLDSSYKEPNIYDTVSPNEDILTTVNVAASIQNLNRLSLPQKSKLESSKSSLAIGTSCLSESKSESNPSCTPIASSLPSSTPKFNLLRPNNSNSEQSNNSFGLSSSEAPSLSSNSLSVPARRNNLLKLSDEHANYVNIDFFLKRNKSISVDDLDEDANATNEDGHCDSNDSEDEVEDPEDDNEDEGEEDEDDDGDDDDDVDDDDDTTQLSHSSDQITEDIFKNMSPREIARKLSTITKENINNNNNNNNLSTSSITPASSGDFLDDSRMTGSSTLESNHQLQLSPSSVYTKSLEGQNAQMASFYNQNRANDDQRFKANSGYPGLKEGSGKFFPSSHPLSAIEENNAMKQQQQINNRTIHSETNHVSSGVLDKNGNALVEAQNTIKSFLNDLNLSPVDDDFEDKAQRRIVKESFAVEFCGRRKLRHLFLFNDVIVCAKYQASSKQKFTFDVRWYLNLNGVSIVDISEPNNQVKYDKEAIENQILAIRTNLMLLRNQIQSSKKSKRKSVKMIKKLKKKRTELEAELVLLLPHLPLVIKHINGKKYTFFLSSNFDRNQWIDSIKFLQSRLPPAKGSSQTTPSSSELQAWIQTCRKNLNPSLGTFLLRSNCDDDLLYGDLHMKPSILSGLTKAGQYYFCFEVDSYGHFSQKASSGVVTVEREEHEINEEFVFPLDGTHTLRILLYEELDQNTKPSVIGKTHIELSKSWLLERTPMEKVILFNTNCSLKAMFSYSHSELLSIRLSNTKLCPTFGLDITNVCKKEKTNVPLIIQMCVNEVERRGMREVGIYRMSGTSTDIQRLKKAFETNSCVAELLLRDIDINSVTGFLKTYLRELPEGLFSNKLYPKFVAAFNTPQSGDSLERTRKMLELFHKIPIANQHTIIYLVEHLVKINRHESFNKMSLTNLATVLGPNILRSPTETTSTTNSVDPFTAVVIGSMSQAGILYFFLDRKFSNLPLTELDSSEIIRQTVEG